MSLTGGASLHSLLHDIITSIVHRIDKEAFDARKDGEWVWEPADHSFAFANDFGPLKTLDLHRLYADAIPEVKGTEVPADWDRSGNLASFSAGSRAAAARSFEGGVRVIGIKRKKGEVPPLPPADLVRAFPPLEGGREVDSPEFLRAMLRVRLECVHYHRYSLSKKKHYWKSTPTYTSKKTRKGEPADTGAAQILDFIGGQLQSILEMAEKGDLKWALALAKEARLSVEDHREESPKRPVLSKPDLRRLTINFHPGHCRAMSRALEAGVDPAILRRVADRVSPLLGAKIEEVTGRKVVAESDHWDTKLFHKNFWNHGCERVRYTVNGVEETRVRRTAFNLNSSGGLLAHDRLRRTFARMGKDFRDYAPEKVAELDKIEDRAKQRQGCLPGDWEINTYADEVMEDALKTEGLGKYVDQGFEEFLAHEILRHESGFGIKMSAKELAERKAAIAGEIRGIEEVGKILGAVDGEEIADAARRVVERTGSLADELGRSSQDAAALRAERDGLKVQVGESATVVSQLKLVLKPDSDESLMAAAKRVTAGAGAVEVLKKQTALLSVERDRFKTMAEKSRGLLERIRVMLKLTPEEKIVPAVERVLGEAHQVPELGKRIGTLENELDLARKSLGVERAKVQTLETEIRPLRRLKELFAKLITHVIKGQLFSKLPNSVQKRLEEMAESVDTKIVITDQEME